MARVKVVHHIEYSDHQIAVVPLLLGDGSARHAVKVGLPQRPQRCIYDYVAVKIDYAVYVMWQQVGCKQTETDSPRPLSYLFRQLCQFFLRDMDDIYLAIILVRQTEKAVHVTVAESVSQYMYDETVVAVALQHRGQHHAAIGGIIPVGGTKKMDWFDMGRG